MKSFMKAKVREMYGVRCTRYDVGGLDVELAGNADLADGRVGADAG
jgi:hypothetical protein